MSNVTHLSAARASGAGQQSRPESINPVAALVAAIDKAVGDKWSFDIVHHETVGDETIVFTKLVVDGRYRVGIGGTSEKGTLVRDDSGPGSLAASVVGGPGLGDPVS